MEREVACRGVIVLHSHIAVPTPYEMRLGFDFLLTLSSLQICFFPYLFCFLHIVPMKTCLQSIFKMPDRNGGAVTQHLAYNALLSGSQSQHNGWTLALKRNEAKVEKTKEISENKIKKKMREKRKKFVQETKMKMHIDSKGETIANMVRHQEKREISTHSKSQTLESRWDLCFVFCFNKKPQG